MLYKTILLDPRNETNIPPGNVQFEQSFVEEIISNILKNITLRCSFPQPLKLLGFLKTYCKF